MADEATPQLHSALNTPLSITEKSGNLRRDLKRDIVDSVSALRNIFLNLKNSAEEHVGKITLHENEVKKVKGELRESRAANLSARKWTAMDEIHTYIHTYKHTYFQSIHLGAISTYSNFPSSVSNISSVTNVSIYIAVHSPIPVTVRSKA
jgi:hypothetical protein